MHSYRISAVPECWEVYYDTGGQQVIVIKTFREEVNAARLVHYLNGGCELELQATVHRLLQMGS